MARRWWFTISRASRLGGLGGSGRLWRRKGVLGTARGEVKALDAELKELKAKTKDTPKPLVIARQELEGHIAFAAGKFDKSFQTLQAAIRAERGLRYTEPPSYPRPVAEALGPKALKQGKLQIAEDAFRQALEQYPGSSSSTQGLAETLRRAGKAEAAGF